MGFDEQNPKKKQSSKWSLPKIVISRGPYSVNSPTVQSPRKMFHSYYLVQWQWIGPQEFKNLSVVKVQNSKWNNVEPLAAEK